MIVNNFCTMTCGNCSFNDGLCYTSMPPQYRCAFDNNFYDGFHACHLVLAPVVHAKWNEINSYDDLDNIIFTLRYFCSNCKCEEDYQSDYCPNCGAKMDLED